MHISDGQGMHGRTGQGTGRRRGCLRPALLLGLLIAAGCFGLHLLARQPIPLDSGGGEVLSTAQQGTPASPALTATSGDRQTLLRALERAAEDDARLAKIQAQAEDYPDELLVLALKNTDAVDFVLDYPRHRDEAVDSGNIDLSGDCTPGAIPLLMQWDSRWGYGRYGSNLMGLAGCGPSCLSMVVIGLTGDTGANPLAVAEYSADQGWYVEGLGTDWELMRSGAAYYGLSWRELPLDADTLCQALDGGEIIIASMLPGDFTDNGHFIVLSGYDASGFRVLDPNSCVRSGQRWSYESLKGQIANLWAYSA